MKPYIAPFALACAVLACANAHATIIVDTGPGPSDPSESPTTNWGLYEKQWLAERFELKTHTTITQAEGWIGSYSPESRTAHAVIYSDAGSSGPGQRLYEQQFATDSFEPGFAGARGVQWALDAGTYFIAFEVQPGDTLMGSMPSSSKNPLHFGSYGYYAMTPFESRWYHSIDTELGLRIEGEVPEPSVPALAGIGALGLLLARRSKRRQ